jgi:hypothetical protein
MAYSLSPWERVGVRASRHTALTPALSQGEREEHADQSRPAATTACAIAFGSVNQTSWLPEHSM